MSSLWTPDGEHEVPRTREPLPDPDPTGDTSDIHAPDPELDDAIAAVLPEGTTLDDLTPEQRQRAEEMVREMVDTQTRLLETDAASIVANHAMGLYELAVLHLSQTEPDLSQTSLAIDALAGIVDNLTGRLGEAEPTLREALNQLRLGFVQVKSRQSAPEDSDSETADDSEPDDTGD